MDDMHYADIIQLMVDVDQDHLDVMHLMECMDPVGLDVSVGHQN